MESCFLIDALTLTSKIHSSQGLIELFGFQALTFEQRGGRHGYRDGLYYETSVSVYYNGFKEEMGVCIELSGQGCRAFESFGHGDYERIFSEYFENPSEVKITRLDVAFDDRDELLDIHQLSDDTRLEQYVSKFRRATVEYGVPADENGNTIYLGSKHSDFFIRIYDKAKERGFFGQHWIRIELQMRRDYAMSFIKGGYTPELLRVGLLGVLRNYIRYVDEDPTDSNKWRWPTKEYWARFLGAAEAVTLFKKPGVEYNLYNLENYVYRGSGNAVATLIDIVGLHEFQRRLAARGTWPNPKYENLKKQCCNTKNMLLQNPASKFELQGDK